MFWPLLVLSLSWGVVQCCLWYSSLLVFVSRELKDAWGNMDLLQVTFYQRCPQGLLTDVWLFFLFCVWSLYPPLQLLLFWDVQQGEIKGREKVMSHLAKFSHGWVIFVTAGKGKTIWPRVFAFDPVTGFSDLWDVLVTLPSWSVGGHCPRRSSPFSYPCRGWNRQNGLVFSIVILWIFFHALRFVRALCISVLLFAIATGLCGLGTY